MKEFKIEVKILTTILVIATVAYASAFIVEIVKVDRKEQEFLNTQVVSIVDKEYKKAYSTTIMVPAMVGKSMVMRPQITHHSAQYILHVKLDDGRLLKINTFELAYETVEIGKRYKYKDL